MLEAIICIKRTLYAIFGLRDIDIIALKASNSIFIVFIDDNDPFCGSGCRTTNYTQKEGL